MWMRARRQQLPLASPQASMEAPERSKLCRWELERPFWHFDILGLAHFHRRESEEVDICYAYSHTHTETKITHTDTCACVAHCPMPSKDMSSTSARATQPSLGLSCARPHHSISVFQTTCKRSCSTVARATAPTAVINPLEGVQ